MRDARGWGRVMGVWAWELDRFAQKGRIPKSVFQDIRQRFAEMVAEADVTEDGSGIGVAGEVLKVDDVRPALAGGGECRHPQRVDGQRRVEPNLLP